MKLSNWWSPATAGTATATSTNPIAASVPSLPKTSVHIEVRWRPGAGPLVRPLVALAQKSAAAVA
ncbi:hypothetical protein [Actinomadura opuntiae]|uniref:hypothetical protein n=1 Tax=Actinomadura sp. OS1-43 TaxID=604315 RepID=UPI00255AA2A6|nr:hypothetical protein [Actinomadura sp. OS1-43]MDL4821505.1 hypothetical protein [Actinomadura sp. OS1-43]